MEARGISAFHNPLTVFFTSQLIRNFTCQISANQKQLSRSEFELLLLKLITTQYASVTVGAKPCLDATRNTIFSFLREGVENTRRLQSSEMLFQTFTIIPQF